MTAQHTRPAAIVTGAARGIGAATVIKLVEDGWNVIAVDACTDNPELTYPLARPEDLEALAARHPDQIRAVIADVRDVAALSSAVMLAREPFGELRAAIACAGILYGGQLTWEDKPSAWDLQIGVNLTGVWNLARVAIPAMLERTEATSIRSHAAFVAIASAAGVKGLPLLGAYSASKHGVIGLIRALACELGPLGITANAICPGSTETDLLDASAQVYGLDNRDEFIQHHLLNRLVAPDDVAALATYLCSSSAAAITGAIMPVDAGMTAR